MVKSVMRGCFTPKAACGKAGGMRILVTRAAEDAAATAAELARLGHEAVLAPLLTTHFLPGPALALEGVQAILATSANGVRALARRTGRRDIPLFAVGPQTAAEARELGFLSVRNADGDAARLAEAAQDWAMPGKGLLLHVSGENAPGLLVERLAARGFTAERAALYRVEAAPALPPAGADAIAARALDGALFFSPRSAALFADLAGEMPLGTIRAFCISPATAAALSPLKFVAVRVAAAPNQEALLKLLPSG
jgi:uroporphyrinogen-III synthase